MGAGPVPVTGYADVNGARLYYEVAGEGHPLVLLHGGLVDSGLWDPQFPVFAERYRTVRYDLRGYGRSSDAVAPYSHVEDLRGLLDALGVGEAHVLGLSLSGGVAIEFALAHPERVSALILAGSGLPGYPYREAEDEESRRIEALFEEEAAALERGDVARAVDISLEVWTDGPHRAPDRVDAGAREAVRAMTTRLYSRGEPPRTEPLDPPAFGRIGEIAAPTLVIRGEEDLAEVRDAAEVLAARIPGARTAVIPDAAHHPNLEKPEEFNRIVLEFLAEVG